MYILTLLLITTWLRPRLGQKTWRSIHYGGFLTWLTALIHGVDAGTDSGVGWVMMIYIATAAAIFTLLVYRVLLPTPSRQGARSQRTA